MLLSENAAELIASVREAGGIIRYDGDMIELAAPTPLPADLVARIRRAKPEVIAALSNADRPNAPADAAWWRRDFMLRTLKRLIGGRPRHFAERLAFNDLVVEWHRRYGVQVPQSQCAGCGAPIGDLIFLDLHDGNRVHFDSQTACLVRYGRQWRGAARDALLAMGLRDPAKGGDDEH